MKRLFKLIRGNQGSFTLEATFVFPLIMLCTFALLFLGMFVYQKVYLQQIAELAAERSAYVWDNSHKQIDSGNYNPTEHDGLYWRFTQDSMSDLFGFLVSNPPTTIQLPMVSSSSSLNKAEYKLARAIAFIPANLTGKLTYTNHGYDRKITAVIEKPFHLPAFMKNWLKRADIVEVQASSRVVEPVELMRLTDLTRTYVAVIKNKISPKAAKAVLIEPQQSSQAAQEVAFTTETEASQYLRALVNGSVKDIPTTIGKSRRIDALDSNGVAHQAFITFTEQQLLSDQMPKDVELLQVGKEVKGVVWHFFKRKGKATPLPSEKLRRKLEQSGIVVVIHE